MGATLISRSKGRNAGRVAQATHDNLAAIAADSNVTGMHPSCVRSLVDNGYVTVAATLTEKGRAALAKEPIKPRGYRKAREFEDIASAWRLPPQPAQQDEEA